MRKGYCLFIAVIITLFTAGWAFPSQDNGIIEGMVRNGTTDSPVKGVKVELNIFKRDKELSFIKRLETSTDLKGSYKFDSLDRGLLYVLKVNYKFIGYDSGPIIFDGKERIDSVVTVYEPSEEGEEDVEFESRHLIVEPAEDGVLAVTEVLTFLNRRKTSFIGRIENEAHGRVTFKMPLPEGYQGLYFYSNPGGFMDMSGELMMGSPILPGVSSFSYAYQILYSGGRHTLYIPFSVSTNKPKRFNLIVSKGIEVKGSALILQETRKIGNKDYSLYTTTAPLRDDYREMKVVFKGLPHKSKLLGVIVFFLSFVFIFLFTYLLIKRNRSRYAKARSDYRDSLIRDAALMDEGFARGELEEAEYRFEKKRLMDELVRLESKRQER